MDVSIPLCEMQSKILPVTAHLNISGSETALHTHLSHTAANFFCAYDGTRGVVFSLEADTGIYHTVCVLFFRKTKDGRHALNVTRTFRELLVVSEGFCYKPLLPSSEVHVCITKDILIERVVVIGDRVVVASGCGSLGCVSLSSLSSASPVGFLIVSSPTARGFPAFTWAFDEDSVRVARMWSSGVTLYRLGNPNQTSDLSTDATTVHEVSLSGVDIGFEDVTSAACFVESGEPLNVVVILCHRSKRSVTVLTLALSQTLTLKSVECATVQKSVDLAVFPRPNPCAYIESTLRDTAGERLLAVLYPDCVAFGTIVAGVLSVSAVLKNELNLAFDTGCWEATRGKSCRFLVFRSDSVCLKYEVTYDSAATLRIVEIALAAQFAIPFPTAIPLRGMGERILAVKNAEALLRDNDQNDGDGGDGVAFLQEPASRDFRPLGSGECFRENNADNFPSAMQLLEVLSGPQGHNILTVLNNGECLLASTTKRGKRCIAVVDNPYEVTSCLAFEMENDTACVLGFADGNVQVFVGERFTCLVRMAHCGPVNRLLHFPSGAAAHAPDEVGVARSPFAADETTFISICTELGTICFHTGIKAEIAKTMTSPSRPLTSCYLDRQSEYLFAFSNMTGNLWHLPTCRLERAFTCSLDDILMREDMVDLLATHWTSTMGIQSLPFLGQIYYAVRVNIGKLVAGLAATRKVSRDVTYALSLLLRCCGVSESTSSGAGSAKPVHRGDESSEQHLVLAEDALLNVLEDLSLGVLPSSAVEPGIGAVALTAAIVEAVEDKMLASKAASLNLRLHEALLRNTQATIDETEHALATYFAAFFNLGQAVPTTLRDGFGRMVACFPSEVAESIAIRMISQDEVQLRGSTASSTQALEGGHSICVSADSFCFLATVLAIRNATTTMAKSGVLEALRLSAKAKCTALSKSALSKNGGPNGLTKEDLYTLLGLSEGYSLFTNLPEIHNLLERLVWHAFEGVQPDTRRLCEDALLRITAQDVEGVVRDTLEGYLQSRPAWRPSIIAFLAHFVKAFPSRATSRFSTLLELSLKVISPSTAPASADERALSTDATMQLVRVAVTHLPSVSLQKHSQHLAVGQEDGKVKVYNLKTLETVSVFQAHSHPVACLSYSSNTASYDIATASTRMGKVKVFRSPKQSTSLVSFFAGSSNQFKFETQIALPSAEIPLGEKLLLVRFCGLKWLSPQCVEFSSPWHEKIQMTL